MTALGITVAILVILGVPAYVRERIRRRRQILRFAELAGVRRMHGESLDDLLARATARFRIFSPRVVRLAVGEEVQVGDLVSIDSQGRARRARGGDHGN